MRLISYLQYIGVAKYSTPRPSRLCCNFKKSILPDVILPEKPMLLTPILVMTKHSYPLPTLYRQCITCALSTLKGLQYHRNAQYERSNTIWISIHCKWHTENFMWVHVTYFPLGLCVWVHAPPSYKWGAHAWGGGAYLAGFPPSLASLGMWILWIILTKVSHHRHIIYCTQYQS